MVIYRSKITKTVFQAKQIINHGKIKVNNKIITSSNIILNRGDIITLNNFKIIKNFYYINKVKIIKLKKNKIKKFTRLIRILKKMNIKNKKNYLIITALYCGGFFRLAYVSLRCTCFDEVLSLCKNNAYA